LAVVREHSPAVEYYSIDEFFFRVVPPPGEDYRGAAARLPDDIKARVGVPVTVGIARSRTLAKFVSDGAKPFGAEAVLAGRAGETLLAVEPGTGSGATAGRRAAGLLPHGIVTCLDFAGADRRLIRALLTATGEALWWEVNGEPVLPLNTTRPLHKALSRG